MSTLIAAVGLVGALCVLDLMLTFGVIRRLREHADLLAGSAGAGLPAVGLAPGELPGAFDVRTVSGQVLRKAAGLRMVAFFSAGCAACPERVPPFVEYLDRHRIGPESVLAVVVGNGGPGVPYLDRLAEVAMTSIQPADNDIAPAFRLSGFPAFCLIDADGAVTASGFEPAALPAPAAV